MGISASTASSRAREMRRVLGRWQRRGLTLREFAEQRGDSTEHAGWWPQVFRRAGAQVNATSTIVPATDAVVFTEVVTAGDGSEDTIGSVDRPARRACSAGAGGGVRASTLHSITHQCMTDTCAM